MNIKNIYEKYQKIEKQNLRHPNNNGVYYFSKCLHSKYNDYTEFSKYSPNV